MILFCFYQFLSRTYCFWRVFCSCNYSVLIRFSLPTTVFGTYFVIVTTMLENYLYN
ncbi:hypothetical protein Barb6_03073 [Bacteroidales bacterium Barb6]|nr:hypothetical protein Barb6_03073 [Bacteroidales bacterium Barb6]